MKKLFFCIWIFILSFSLCFSNSGQLSENIIKKQFEDLADYYLKPFSKGFHKKQLDDAEKKDPEMIRYVVSNGKLYIRGLECKAITSLILYLLKEKQSLPDLDFLYLNTTVGLYEYNAPVFCQCKYPRYKTSLIPFHDRMCPLGNIKKNPHRDDNLIFKTINNNQIDWYDRLDQLIWRGCAVANKNYFKNIQQDCRGKICFLSSLYPNLIDAKFTIQYHFNGKFKNQPNNKYIINCDPKYKGNILSIEDQLKYKFQIILYGAAISGCFPGIRWRLASGSTCFFLGFDQYMVWHFPLLKKYIHFIPIEFNEMHKLPELIMLYSIIKREEARKIANNSRQFALNYLTSERIALFCRIILEKYARLYRGTPKIDTSFKERKEDKEFKNHIFF